ncbi:MAG TPA: MarC family protein [Actinomycetales bacterium]|nr:MarC family protein [Actinomycetales bacterium]
MSTIDWRLLSEVFVVLFVIMDPPGTIPVFLALTEAQTAKQRARAARQATFVSLGVILVFALFGQSILDYLHISLPALQASGGLLLLLIALELLTGKFDEDPKGREGVNVALVPLGIPLLAGPGAIVATMVFIHSASGAAEFSAIYLGIIAVHITIFAALRFSNVIHRILGASGTILVTRIAGILLAAIAVQLIADAVTTFMAEV